MLTIRWWLNYQSQSRILDPPSEYIRQTHSFQQGKLQLSLAKPDKDEYDTRDNKQHNLQQ